MTPTLANWWFSTWGEISDFSLEIFLSVMKNILSSHGLKCWRATACFGKLKFAISFGWPQKTSVSHPDDLTMGIISSRWFNFWQYLIRMTYGHCNMSPGWLSWSWYLIQMSYDNVIMSNGWHALPFLSHLDEIANFDFLQHTVALQRFPHHRTCLTVGHMGATTNNTNVFQSERTKTKASAVLLMGKYLHHCNGTHHPLFNKSKLTRRII